MKTRFSESHTLNFIKRPTKTGRVWDVVLIETGISKNNKFYSEAVLRESAHLFEGVKAGLYGFGNHFDHVPDNMAQSIGRMTKNIVGWFDNVRFGSFVRQDKTTGTGLLARFNIFEVEKTLQSKLQEAFTNGHANLLGLSIDAKGSGHSETTMNGRTVLKVGKIDSVQEVTVVSQPSAGGGVLRLVASIGDCNMKTFYAQLCLKRNGWMEGFAQQDAEKMDDAQLKDHVTRILESNLNLAQTGLIEIPSDEVDRLAAHGCGIKSISEMLACVKGDDVAGANRLMEAWGEAENVYELPFKTAKPAKPAPKVEPAPAPAAAPAPAGDDALAIRESAVLVKERLIESELPKDAYSRISVLFDGKANVNVNDVDKAISDEVAYRARMKEGEGLVNVGNGHGTPKPKVEVGDGQNEKFAKAFDGFFDMGRSVDGVAPFTGLKEAFGQITGRWASPRQMTDMVFRSIQLAFPQNSRTTVEEHLTRVRESWNEMVPPSLRESITTGDFTVLFGDSMNRRLQKEYTSSSLNDWRDVISSIENLSDATNAFNVPRIGGQTILPVVEEGAPYQEGTDPTELNETITPSKRGRLLKFTWEDVLADRVGVIRRFPRILARSSNRTIQRVIFDEIELNPTMADGNLLLSSGHANLVSGSPALTGTAFNAAVLLLRDQTEQDSGDKLGLSPFKLLTGPALEATAIEITDSRIKPTSSEDATVTNVNNKWGVSSMMSIALGRSGTTDGHFWVMADPRDVETIAVGFLGGRDQPDMFVQGVDTPTSGSFFDADEITIKARLVVGATVVDWRGFAGSLQ